MLTFKKNWVTNEMRKLETNKKNLEKPRQDELLQQ